MKNSIKKLIILSLLLIIIYVIIILICGKTYSFSVISNKDINIINEEDVVEVLDVKKETDRTIVKIKPLKPGKTSLIVDYGSHMTYQVLYVHKSMIITDNSYFGKSNASEVIPISFSIILIYSLVLLIKKYISSIRDNIFQYKNIAYLGIIVFTSFFALSNIISIFNYRGLSQTINNTISSMTALSILLYPIAVITFVMVTISNIILIRKEGKSLRNLLGLFLGIFICVLTVLPNFVYGILMKAQIVDIYNLNSIGPYAYSFVESIVYLVIAYLECVLIGTIIIAIKSVKKKVTLDKDYIIILGCQIRKDGTLTPLLKGRVDKALEFRNKQLKESNKDLIFIPSGAKGSDEVISEAEAMKNYLLTQGIDEKSILVDDKSKNTFENIKFSNKLIKKKNANIAFSTTNYHVLRAGLIATEQGLKLDGLGSSTKSYFWINAFIREFIGTLFEERKKHIIVFSLIIVILILMITITYFDNNI